MPFTGGATADPHSHLVMAREIAENRLLLSAVSRSVYKRRDTSTHHTSSFKAFKGLARRLQTLLHPYTQSES